MDLKPPPRVVAKSQPREDDAAVLLRIADGGLSALGEMYDRYHADVRRVLGRILSDAHDIDDLIQQTFLELPKVARAFDGRHSARAWIIGIAVRLASRRRRSLARWMRAREAFGELAVAHVLNNPETQTLEREELRLFERALGHLSLEKRSVFVLIEVEGISPADVAASLDIPPATVRTRLFHARAELRAALKGVRA